jgi:hypothetical protein
LLITVPASYTGIARLRQFAEAREVNGDETIVPGQLAPSLIQRGIPHQIDNRAMLLKASAIEVAPTFHTDQVRYLNGEKRLERWRASTPGGIPSDATAISSTESR